MESYWVRLNGRYPTWGPLYLAGLLKEPRYLFCPSAADPFHSCNGPENPSRPETGNTRGGYFLRPRHYDGTPVLWRTTATSPHAPPVDAMNPNQTEWRPYPKLSKLRSRALASDIFSTPHRINWRHVKGINVLYADGSGKWQDRGAFNRLPDSWTLPRGVSATAGWNTDVAVFNGMQQNFTAGATSNGTMAAIWEISTGKAGPPRVPTSSFPDRVGT